jgi:uncharacterized protein YgbK (DUF1537 family)
MLRALILADDLSGAADCGAAFTRAGLDTIVSFGDAPGAIAAEVLAIDADTRRLPSAEAADVVDRLVRRYGAERDVVLFKKIDSTLRGHVGIELAAALRAYRSLHPGAVAVCAPAFPAIGRTTVNGVQWMHGDPLHQTELWRLHGLTHTANIPEIMQSAGLQTTLVPLANIRSPGGPLAKEMAQAPAETDVLVCDAETEDDLQAIALAALHMERKPLLVGSAGLAYHLPHAAGLSRQPAPIFHNHPPTAGPLLFVIGSRSHNSLAQIKTLTDCSRTVHLSISPAILLAGPGSPGWQTCQQQLEQAIADQKDVLLAPGFELQVEGRDQSRLSLALARMTAGVSDRVGALIAAGGETARSVLQCWNVSALRLLGELEKGVPVAVTEQWIRSLAVITKAGDFGQPETLLHCARFLHRTHGDPS